MIKNTKVYKYYDQVKQEMQKIIWPAKKNLVLSTTVVLISVLITSVICLFIDYSIHSIIKFLLKIGK